MEGVGARLGRSSTRYGPATVFNGPVRKWKKKWVHASPSSSNTNNHSHTATNTTYANNAPHFKLYKWTPISQSSDAAAADKDDAAAVAPPEDPPRRKFKYIPVAVLEEQKKEDAENEAAEKVEEDEAKLTETESSLNRHVMEEKPDINDLPMEEDNEAEDNIQSVRQDLNESTLDLCLGFEDGDGGSEPRASQ